MFCPNCKTEYRAGFTECSDCGASLVETLPDERSDADVPELFWSGNSPRLCQEFRAALKAADIPFMDQPPPRYLYSSLRPPLEIWTSKSDHEAAAEVRRQITGESDDELAGRESLSELQGGGRAPNPYRDPTRPTRPSGFLGTWASAEEIESSNSLEAPDEVGEEGNRDGSNLLKEYFSSPAPDNIFTGEFYPENATAQVYSGEPDIAENLKACLREVGIPSVIDEQGKGSSVGLRVLPDHQARAKEIIREVIEATPPE